MISSFFSKQRSSRSTVAIVTVRLHRRACSRTGAGGRRLRQQGRSRGQVVQRPEAETVEFTADGKMTVTGDAEDVTELTYIAEDGKLTVTVMGQSATTPYTLDGDTLTVTDPETQRARDLRARQVVRGCWAAKLLSRGGAWPMRAGAPPETATRDWPSGQPTLGSNKEAAK